MIFFTLFEWTLNFFAIGNNIFIIILKILTRVMLMYVNYLFVIGLADIEKHCGIGFNSKKLLKFWYILTSVNIAGVIIAYLFSDLYIHVLVAVYAVNVVYMYQMYIMKKLFYSAM